MDTSTRGLVIECGEKVGKLFLRIILSLFMNNENKIMLQRWKSMLEIVSSDFIDHQTNSAQAPI